MAPETKYGPPNCGACGTGTRTMYAQSRGSGKNTKSQHSRWRVCKRGHKVYKKRS